MSLCSTHADIVMQVAMSSIRHGLDHRSALVVDVNAHEAPLREQRSSFVTLHLGGHLRGCMGGLTARFALLDDVAQHAFMAAFKDPRFPGVCQHELAQLDIHVSILGAQTPIQFADEVDLVVQLRPGIDGLIIGRDSRRATFLPSVWDNLTEPTSYLRRLKEKAGIAPTESPAQAWRFTVESIPK